MRSPLLETTPMRRERAGKTLPPGSGVLITGAVSLLLWGVFAGIMVIV